MGVSKTLGTVAAHRTRGSNVDKAKLIEDRDGLEMSP